MVSPKLRALRWAAPGALLLVVAAAVGGVRALRPAPPAPEAADTAPPAVVASTAIAEPAPAPAPAPPPAPPRCPPEPPLEIRAIAVPPPLELARLVREDPGRLGSASIGTPTRGRLWGAVELVASEGIEPAGDHPFGTEAVVRSIERAVREVRRCFPDTPKLHVGDISRKEGGWLKPHKSHQAGLDADIGYYYLGGAAWYQQAGAANLDRARTWALVRALVESENVEMIFMDRAVQRLLREHAATIDEGDRADTLFEGEEHRRDAVIRHASGHGGHFHVRFRDPASVALGIRLEPMLRGRSPAARAGTSPPARTPPPKKAPPKQAPKKR